MQDHGLRGQFNIPTHGMAGGLGSFSGGATLERSKLDTKREVKTVDPKLDDAGGGGGIGKGLSNGGGGDDDGGDDDDYGNGFGEGGDDGEGDGFFRAVLQQLYNPEALKAVLTEFGMTMADLPAMLRQSVEMGLFSSAMLHTFLTTDVRPSLTRAVTRSMPQRVSLCFLLVTSKTQSIKFSAPWTPSLSMFMPISSHFNIHLCRTLAQATRSACT